ncbi:MAG: VTT domain-containing protein [Candidatus Omnitrophota bacterium]
MVKVGSGLRFLIFLLILSLFWYLSRYIKIESVLLQDFLARFPFFFSLIIYILLYVVVTFFIFFSKDFFWFIGAFLFGPFLSAVLICLAEAINACILFYLARFMGRDYVEDKLQGRYGFLDKKISRLNLFWLFIFRATPFVPYRFMDLAAGLTGMRFSKYLTALFLGTPLKMLWIQYIIYTLGVSIFSNPKALANYFIENKEFLLFSYIYLILVVMVVIKISSKEKEP